MHDHLCREESNMKNGIALSCLLVAIAGLSWLVASCSSTSTLAVQQAGYPKDKVDAPGLFTENCATCHGRNGRAGHFMAGSWARRILPTPAGRQPLRMTK